MKRKEVSLQKSANVHDVQDIQVVREVVVHVGYRRSTSEKKMKSCTRSPDRAYVGTVRAMFTALSLRARVSRSAVFCKRKGENSVAPDITGVLTARKTVVARRTRWS